MNPTTKFFDRLATLVALICIASPLSADQFGNFKYTEYGTYVTITGYPSSATGIVEIPPMIANKPVTGIGASAFSQCSMLTGITIPPSITSIGDSAFSGCCALTGITIPSGVTTIGIYAFSRCRGLTSVTIPSSVSFLNGSPFPNCGGLTTIVVAAGNPSYASVDGVLFNLTRTGLIQCPGGKTGVYSIPSSVKTISTNAFYGCSGLTGVTIPSSVTSIGSSAFSNCSNLTSLTIPSSLTNIGSEAFTNCSSLPSISVQPGNSKYVSVDGVLFNFLQTTLVQCPAGKAGIYEIPGGVTSIASYAFYGCNRLTSVAVPAGVTSIADYAFYQCSGPSSITIPAGVTGIGSLAFYHCTSITSITIPSGVTSIGYGAFSECTALTDVTIPSTVTSIGNSAFSACWLLSKATIPSSVTSIGDYMFSSCHSLASVTLPYGVTSIGTSAFNSCRALQSVTVPSSVTSIGLLAFYGCIGMAAIAVETGNTNYVSVDGVLFNSQLTTLIQYPCGRTGGYSIPSTVTSIGSSAFSLCSGLSDIAIPSSVTSIGSSAFYGCINLSGITIPSNVTSIGGSAFQNCVNLPSVTIPSGVTSIGSNPFAGCSGLAPIVVEPANSNYVSVDGVLFNFLQTTLIQCPGAKTGTYAVPSGVTSVGSYAFSGCGGLTSITIPSSVTSISETAFNNCNGLTSIVSDSSNSYFVSIGGVLFNPSQTLLVRYPAGKSGAYIIPSGVTNIGNYAFYGAATLADVTIPPSVASIGTYAFSGCTALGSVTIPSSVSNMGNSVFLSCTGLTAAVFLGNAPELASSPYSGMSPSFATYYFSGGNRFSSPTWQRWPSVQIDESTYPAAPWLLSYGYPYDANLNDDPNNDGVNLLMAYALNMNPNLVLCGNLPSLVLGSEAISLTYYAASPGIAYRVETSEDLQYWVTDGVTLSGIGGDGMRTATVDRNSPSKFLRLVVHD